MKAASRRDRSNRGGKEKLTEWRHLEWSRKRSGEWIKEQREIDGTASPGVEPE